MIVVIGGTSKPASGGGGRRAGDAGAELDGAAADQMERKRRGRRRDAVARTWPDDNRTTRPPTICHGQALYTLVYANRGLKSRVYSNFSTGDDNRELGRRRVHMHTNTVIIGRRRVSQAQLNNKLRVSTKC